MNDPQLDAEIEILERAARRETHELEPDNLTEARGIIELGYWLSAALICASLIFAIVTIYGRG